ncbi:MAG: rhodanese-like domain-containing protein [Thermosynechococcaceae cyanobacterium]
MTSIPQVTDLAPKTFVQHPNPPLLIDVRSGPEYNLFHAPDAVNLSLPKILLGRLPGLKRWAWPQWFQDLPKDQPVALICLTAHRSPLAAQQLIKAGFTQVFNITGGMMQWRQSGLATIAGSQPSAPTNQPIVEGSSNP